MPYNYKIEAFCGRDFSRGTTSTTTSCCDIGLVQLATMHRLPTSTTTTMPFETDEAERHGRAPLMFQLRYTGSWTPTRPWMTPMPTSTPPPSSCMENVKRRPKMTTTAA